PCTRCRNRGLGDGHPRIPQRLEDDTGPDLLLAVLPIPADGIDRGGGEDPALVVVPQCLDAQPGQGGELSDVHHVTSVGSPLRGGSRRGAGSGPTPAWLRCWAPLM